MMQLLKPDELLTYESVRQTLARYACAIDSGKLDDVLSTFTEDAVFMPLGGDSRQACGHAEIVRFLSELGVVASRLSGKYKPVFSLSHHLTTSNITLNSDTDVKGFTRFLALSPSGLDHSGFYSDRLSLVNGRWLLSYRKITLDWISPDSLVRELMTELA